MTEILLNSREYSLNDLSRFVLTIDYLEREGYV